MKKFRFQNKSMKIKIIVFILIFLILFILISFSKLKHSYRNLENILLKSFDSNKSNNLSFLTTDLDKLFNTYAFYDTKKEIKEEKPTIYLYNTHDNEIYFDNTTISEATKLFQSNLTKLGIKVIVEEEKPSQLLHTGLTNYNISRTFINNIKQKEKNIQYYIDVHRDTATDTTIKINNKSYAKILFVLGLENKNYLKNKAIMLKMNDYLNKNYPNLSKGIYEKKGSGVDGVYNQDLDEGVILIEIGGIKNTREEINNSTEILSLMLYHMLGD